MDVLQVKDMQHFNIPDDLPTFSQSKAQWPRSREIYQAPLLIVKEMLLGSPRVLAAVSERDLVFTNSYFAVSLPRGHTRTAHLLATVLSSAFATWFFYLTAAEFGIYKRKLLARDLSFLPVPNFTSAVKSEAGQRLLQIEKNLRANGTDERGWAELDEAVFDLYELNDADRTVIRDGLLRAGWQWETGRESSVEPSDSRTEVTAYAKTFLSVIEDWLSVRNKRHMRAEVLDLPSSSALRVVRFVLEEGPGNASVSVVAPQGELGEVLARIGRRLKVKIATALSAERELRVHGRNEVVIIKPAARRYWMGIAALEDADAVVAESFSGGKV